MVFNGSYTSDNSTLVPPLDSFYTDAAAGELSEFTIIGPSCCGVRTTSMHPRGLIPDGEGLIKAVYKGLRASPQ